MHTPPNHSNPSRTSPGTTGGRASTRLLGAADVAEVIRRRGLDAVLVELIDRLRHALMAHDETRIVSPLRSGFHYASPTAGLLELMPVMELGRTVGVKTVGYHPSNPSTRGLPSVMATTSLYDTSTGRILALLDATLLTALRTGAAAAIAADVLAVEGPVVVGVVGCGAQAVTQLHALDKVRPIERIVAFDTNASAASSFARRTAFLDRAVKVISADETGLLVTDTDVLVTATTVEVAAGPVVRDGDHRPWLHVSAIGSDFAGKQELPTSLLERAVVCPDLAAQCRVEGESQWIPDRPLGPNLAQLVQRADEHAADLRSRLTVFDSTGWALEDLVAAEMIVDHAAALGIGMTVDLQATASDPLDPYGALEP
jgi:L-lysine cyclodeaminase